jgi:hypothetical protein
MSKKKDPSWKTYEEIAALVLNQCAAEFGIERVEGKQDVAGKSGTEWEVDARAWAAGDAAHLLVECKKHSNTGISQAITSSLAWQILDTDAEGGFLVSPNGLQAGAKFVAAVANIREIKLDPRSTPSAWFGDWLGKQRAGFTDEVKVGASEHLLINSIDKHGTETVVYDSAKDETKKPAADTPDPQLPPRRYFIRFPDQLGTLDI